MQPDFKVQINEEGECIHSSTGAGLDEAIDGNSESMGYIIHTGCSGFVDRLRNVSRSVDVLVCRACNLRLHISKNLETWHDFLLYFKKSLSLGKLECDKCKRLQYISIQNEGLRCELPDYPDEEVCDGVLSISIRQTEV